VLTESTLARLGVDVARAPPDCASRHSRAGPHDRRGPPD
jgi:hypothetical protein